MDIDTYLKFNLDIKLVKEVLLDKDQRLVLDTSSSLLNFKRFFDKIDITDKTSSFSEYKKKNFANFFESLFVLFKRNNTTDRRVINFIQKNIDD